MDIRQVTETIAMIEEQNFDIRTITMGISLLDCIDTDINRAAEKIYQKISTKAKDLVAVGDEIAAELRDSDFSDWGSDRQQRLRASGQGFRQGGQGNRC